MMPNRNDCQEFDKVFECLHEHDKRLTSVEAKTEIHAKNADQQNEVVNEIREALIRLTTVTETGFSAVKYGLIISVVIIGAGWAMYEHFGR